MRKLQFLNKLFCFRCGILKIRINPDEGNRLLGKELAQGLKPNGVMPGNRAFDANKQYHSETVGLGKRNHATVDRLCFPIQIVFKEHFPKRAVPQSRKKPATWP
jgi:hypothetical protein